MVDTDTEPRRFLDLDAPDLAPVGCIGRLGTTDYQMRSPDGLSLAEIGMLQQLETRLGKAMRQYGDSLDSDAANEASAQLDAMLRLILPDLPAEELARLGYLKKTKVYAFFNNRLAEFERTIQAAMNPRPPSPPTTPTSSPDSVSTTVSGSES